MILIIDSSTQNLGTARRTLTILGNETVDSQLPAVQCKRVRLCAARSEVGSTKVFKPHSELFDFNRTEKGYPLAIEATDVVVEESPVDRELIVKLLPKLDYGVLLGAAQQLSVNCTIPDLPDDLPESPNDTLVAALHRVLMDIHVQEGNLVCPDTGRKFPIKEGIPNMILHEDEL